MDKFKTALLGIGLSCAALPAMADTVTNSFVARIVIQKTCDVTTTAPTDLDFGTRNLLNANFDATSAVTLTCTNGTTYDVGLNAGVNAGTAGDVSTRRMANGAEYVSYNMYSNAGSTTVWGNTVSTNTVAGTGNGTPQTLTVYGRVPVQSPTPAPGTYLDTVTVTVTY